MATTYSKSASFQTNSIACVRTIVRDLDAATLSETEIELLNGIADFALAHLQEARRLQAERDALLAQAVEYEVLIQAKIAAESDALDHQIAHLV
jgi:GAF domain-containing protein